MFVQVNGERHPGDVYKDFKAAVMRILGTQDNPPIFSTGQPPEVPADVTTELPTMVSIALQILHYSFLTNFPFLFN